MTLKLKDIKLKNVTGGNSSDILICPRCKKLTGITLEQVIKTKSLVCPHCGLRLDID